MDNRIKMFMEKYCKLPDTNNGMEYWKTMVEYLKEENFLDEENLEILRECLSYDDEGIFSEMHEDNGETKICYILERLIESERVYQEKDQTDYGENHRIHLERRKEKGHADPSEEKYIRNFFGRAKKFYVLSGIFMDQYERLFKNFEKRIKYRNYGKPSVLPGNHYCYSAIMDIVCSNTQRAGLTKREPEEFRDIIEYDYDENGRLIMQKWFDLDPEIEFLLYAGDWLISIVYDIRKNIQKIVLRKYENDLISEYELSMLGEWSYPVSGMCRRMNWEKYQYSGDGLIRKAIEEYYSFPIIGQLEERNIAEFLTRDIISFITDQDGCICACKMDIFDGDKLRHSGSYGKLSERKRKSTKKTKGRWRRPNYYVK